MSFSYKKAGVDVNKGDALVDWLVHQKNIKSQNLSENQNTNDAKSTSSRPADSAARGVDVSGIGGFASLYRLPFQKYQKPLLVTCTDGVGTKVKLAAQYKKYFSVAQDMVAMCVNDMICCGADPYIFLDYYAVGELQLEAAKDFLSGVRAACEKSMCDLVGGETAEMPGIYQKGDFDCAGFAVGLVDEDLAWGAHKVQVSDVLIGVSSSGFHSNGYSLVRRLFEKDLDQWAEQLLIPTHLYVQLVQSIKALGIEVHAAAHITGGGIENIPRVLPADIEFVLQDWEWPLLFKEAQARSGLSKSEMLETFNCGLGFVFVVPSASVEKLKLEISKAGFLALDIGYLKKTDPAKLRTSITDPTNGLLSGPTSNPISGRVK